MGGTRTVPGGSGGGITGNGGCTGLAFWRFFSGRGLAKRQLAGTSSVDSADISYARRGGTGYGIFKFLAICSKPVSSSYLLRHRRFEPNRTFSRFPGTSRRRISRIGKVYRVDGPAPCLPSAPRRKWYPRFITTTIR